MMQASSARDAARVQMDTPSGCVRHVWRLLQQQRTDGETQRDERFQCVPLSCGSSEVRTHSVCASV